MSYTADCCQQTRKSKWVIQVLHCCPRTSPEPRGEMRPISIGYVPALAIPNIETMCEMLRKYVTKHTFICPCLYACMSVAMHVHTYIHTYIYIHVHIYIYIYMYICICIYIYMYMYIYIYLYIYNCAMRCNAMRCYGIVLYWSCLVLM